MSDLAVIGFRSDTSGLTKAQRELDKTAYHGQMMEQKIDRVTREMDRSFSALKSTVGMVGAALAAVAAGFATRDVIEYADSWKSVTSQLRQVTESEQELNAVRKLVLQTAKDTRTELQATTNLYAAMDRATTKLGYSTKEQIDITRTINNLFLAGGKSAQEASGAIRQLTQGLESGALRGDEFNSVAENAPRILDALAKSTGIARGELREFAATGGITAEILAKALADYSDEAQRMADQTEITFGQRMEIASTNMTEFFGKLKAVDSAVGGLGSSIENFSAMLVSNVQNINAFGIALAQGFTEMSVRVKGTFDILGEEILFSIQRPLSAIAGKIIDIIQALSGLGGKAASALGFDSSTFDSIITALEGVRPKAVAEHNKMLQDIRNSTDKELELVKKIYGDMFDDIIDLTSDAAAEVDKENPAKAINNISKDAAFSLNELSKSTQALIDKLDPATAANREYGRSYDILLGLMSDGIITHERFIELLAKLEDQHNETTETMIDNTDEWATFTERQIDRVDDAFSSVWENVLTGADDVFSSVKNAFIKMLAEMAHQAITRPIVMNIMGSMGMGGMSGGLGGVANIVGGMSGGGGFGSILGSIGSAVTGGILGAGTGIASLGSMLGLGGSLGAFGSGMAMTGAGLSTVGLGGTISAIGSLFGSGSIAAGLGAALPIVGIAGLGLGAVNKLTGGGLFGTSYKQDDTELSLALYGDSVIGETILHESRKRSLFRGTKRRQTATPFDTASISDYFATVQDLILSSAEALNVDEVTKVITSGSGFEYVRGGFISDIVTREITVSVEEYLKTFNSTFKKSIKDMSEEEIQQAINEWVSTTSEQMIDGVFGGFLKDLKREGESSSDALQRVLLNINAVESAFNLLGHTFDLAGKDAAVAATNIVDFTGGLDLFNQLTASYYQNFYTETEKLDQLLRGLWGSFDSLDMVMPNTMEGFRSLVESLDVTTEEGQKAYAALMNLNPAFTQYINGLSQQVELQKQAARAQLDIAAEARVAEIKRVEGIRREVETEYSKLLGNLAGAGDMVTESYQKEIDKIKERALLLNNVLQEEYSLIQSISNERLNALQSEKSQLEQIALRFEGLADIDGGVEEALNRARLGDFSLAKNIQPRDYQAGNFATRAEFETASALQRNQLLELSGLAGAEVSDIEMQIQAEKANAELMLNKIDQQIANDTSSYEKQIEELIKQRDTLLGVDNSVLSISEATERYQEAQLRVDEFGYAEQISKLDMMIESANDVYALHEQAYQAEIERLDAIVNAQNATITAVQSISTPQEDSSKKVAEIIQEWIQGEHEINTAALKEIAKNTKSTERQLTQMNYGGIEVRNQA